MIKQNVLACQIICHTITAKCIVCLHWNWKRPLKIQHAAAAYQTIQQISRSKSDDKRKFISFVTATARGGLSTYLPLYFDHDVEKEEGSSQITHCIVDAVRLKSLFVLLMRILPYSHHKQKYVWLTVSNEANIFVKEPDPTQLHCISPGDHISNKGKSCFFIEPKIIPIKTIQWFVFIRIIYMVQV